MKTDTCRACAAPIVWTVTDQHVRMPVDAEPSSEGTFHLREEGQDVIATYVRKGSHPELYVSHFATCPESKSWRKRR